MTRFPEVNLGEFLTLNTADEPIIDDLTYHTAGIYSHGRGLFRKPPIQGRETSYSRYTKLCAGQFIYSRLFGWEGAIAVVRPDFSGLYVSHEFPTFTIDPTQADPSYLGYIARWDGLHAKLKDKGTGVGSRRQRVNVDRLLATSIPIPDLHEQRRIAARLATAFSKIARVRQLHTHRADLRSAFKESAIGEASHVAAESLQVKRILTLKRRQVFPEVGVHYREIGIRSFGRGVFHKDPVTGDQIGDKRVFSIEPEDLLFSNVFAWEGAVALAGTAESGMIGSHRFMTYVVNDSLADAGYLKHYFTSEVGLNIIRRASPGSAGRNRTLGIKAFDEQWLQLPEPGTQRRIRQRLDAIATRRMDDASETLGALSRSLLNAAFAGEL